VSDTGPVRFAALRHRNFAILWSGLIVSNVGTTMQNAAMGWLMWELKHSPLWLGYLGLSFALPMCVVPLFSGAAIDRVNRIALLYVTQTAALLIAVALAVLTYSGHLTVWALLGASLLGATFLGFDSPTRQALIPDLVPPRVLLNAISLNSASYNGALLLGPAIAGVLLGEYGLAGAGMVFVLNAVSFLAVILALLLLRDVRTHAGGEPGPVLRALRDGFAFVWRRRLVFGLLGLSALTAVLGRSFQPLLPNFTALWHGGSGAYGFLLAGAGAGALIGAFALSAMHELRNQSAIMVGSGLVFALSVIAVALSPNLVFGGAMVFVSGVSATVFGAITATYIQIATPHELRGRVMSLYTITLIGLPSLGALGVGALAESLGGAQGTPRAVLLGGAVLLVVMVVSAPRLLRAHPGEHPAAERRS